MRTWADVRWNEYTVTDGFEEEFGVRLLFGLNDPRISEFTFILSGIRSYHEQALLYQAYQKWAGDPQKWADEHPGETPPALAAFPGTSNHERGRAADLRLVANSREELNERWALVALVLAEYGLWQSVRNRFNRILEVWHFELDPSRKSFYPTPPVPPAPPAPPEPPPPPTNSEEDEDMALPLARIYGSDTYDAQFILYQSGLVTHLGPGEATMYDEGGPYASVPKVVEFDRIAYHRIVRRSGTNWKPSDMPF